MNIDDLQPGDPITVTLDDAQGVRDVDGYWVGMRTDSVLPTFVFFWSDGGQAVRQICSHSLGSGITLQSMADRWQLRRRHV